MKSLKLGALALVLMSGAAVPGLAADAVTLTYYVDDNPTNVATAEGLKAAFEAENPDIKIEIETHPGGSEGDNLVKTRLATGDMPDVFRYNAGSLFRALNPPETMLDLSNEAFETNVIDSFKPVVSVDGKVYGVPEEAAMGGGVLYNKKIYADLGLSVPKSWAEFMANNAKIKAAGKAPVIQTFGDTWTSQLFVLADYYNVQAAAPDRGPQQSRDRTGPVRDPKDRRDPPRTRLSQARHRGSRAAAPSSDPLKFRERNQGAPRGDVGAASVPSPRA